jgi:hypothetical protein
VKVAEKRLTRSLRRNSGRGRRKPSVVPGCWHCRLSVHLGKSQMDLVEGRRDQGQAWQCRGVWSSAVAGEGNIGGEKAVGISCPGA